MSNLSVQSKTRGVSPNGVRTPRDIRGKATPAAANSKDSSKSNIRAKRGTPSPRPVETIARLSPTMFLGPGEAMNPEAGFRGSQEDLHRQHINAFIDIEKLGGRHLQPIRPNTARSENETIATLKLRELNDEVLDALTSVAVSLKRLDISKTGVAFVPDQLIARLGGLRKLVLNFNRLTEKSFPDSFSTLTTLRELSVAYNDLKTLPKPWLKLRHLTRLNLEGNQLVNLNGVDSLKRLAVLVLDNNSLTELPKELCSLLRLEGIFVKHNNLRALHAQLRSLRRLRVLNASHNVLESVSAEVFCLPRLESLCISHNALVRLPVFSTQSFQGRKISVVDISDNRLARFPEHILRISERLDLSNNKIRNISGNVLKRFDKAAEQQLDLRGNGMLNPPSEVCEAGLREMIRYANETEVQTLAYQGVKIYVFGGRGSGKTSMIRTLIDMEPLPTEPEESTNGVSVLETVLDLPDKLVAQTAVDAVRLAGEIADDKGKIALNRSNSNSNLRSAISSAKSKSKAESSAAKPNIGLLNFMKKSVVTTFWEFGGTSELIPLFSHFLRESALSVIVFDVSTYTSEQFVPNIGAWMDLACTRYFKAYVLLVATHTDLLKPQKLKQVLDQVFVDMRSFLRDKLQLLDRDIRNIETNSTISSTLSEYYSLVLRIKDAEVVLVHSEIVCTSAQTCAGYEQLLACLHRVIITMPAVYPDALQPHPAKFGELEMYTEDLSEKQPLMDFDDYAKQIASRFNLSASKTSEVAGYLNMCGKLLWSRPDKFYSQKLLLRPQVLSDALFALLNFRQTMDQVAVEDNGMLQQPVVTPTELAFGGISLNHFVRHGLLNLPLLKYIWTKATAVLNDEHVLPVARLILETYELGFAADCVNMEELSRRVDTAPLRSNSIRPGTANTVRSDRSSSVPPRATLTGRFSVGRWTAQESRNELGLRVFLPAVVSLPSTELRNELERMQEESVQISAVYQLFGFAAPLIFERLSGRLRKLDMLVYAHWMHGVLARHVTLEHTVVCVEKQLLTDARITCIKITAYSVTAATCLPTVRSDLRSRKSSDSSSFFTTASVHSSSFRVASSASDNSLEADPPRVLRSPVNSGVLYNAADRAVAENMWMVLLPILKDLDELLLEFPGLWFRRMLQCPVCREICFNAEWASQDFHQDNEMVCLVCSSSVPLYLLAQPKEKRKAADLLKLRQQIKEKRNREQELAAAEAEATSSSTSFKSKKTVKAKKL